MTEIYKIVFPDGKETVFKLTPDPVTGIVKYSVSDKFQEITGLALDSTPNSILSTQGYKLYYIGVE